MAKVAETAPPLADALRLILPTSRQTWFLRACLHSEEAGRKAWEAWQSQTGAPGRQSELDEAVVRRLRPLLYVALRRNGVRLDPMTRTTLRMAYLREELRGEIYRKTYAQVLGKLGEQDIPAITVRGAALAGSAYDEWTLRHCHDIDLLMRESDLDRASRALGAVGLKRTPRPGDSVTVDVRLEHASGLPIELHSRAFRLPLGAPQLADTWTHSCSYSIAGQETRIPSPADSLLHVCAHAAHSPSRVTLQWVCDAWHIIRRYPALDWSVLVESAARYHVGLQLYTTLYYLANELDAPIPETAIGQLGEIARTDALGREAALYGARSGGGASVGQLLRHARAWRARVLILKWIFLPSSTYLRALWNVRHPSLLPLYYLYRPLGYFASRILARVIRPSHGGPVS